MHDAPRHEPLDARDRAPRPILTLHAHVSRGELEVIGSEATFRTPSGLSCTIIEAHGNLEVLAHLEEGATRSTHLEEIAWALRLKPEQIARVHEGYAFIPCQVMRQDDHGNEFEIAQFASHLEGRWYVADMERAVHKQTYWVQEL